MSIDWAILVLCYDWLYERINECVNKWMKANEWVNICNWTKVW